MESEQLSDAAKIADALAKQVQLAGEEPALAALETALHDLNDQGYPIEILRPVGMDARLGAALAQAKSGKSFWAAYSEVIRETLCKENSELQKLAKAGLSGSAGALVPVLLAGLALPVAVVSIVVPMAAIIAALGIDAFCQWSAPEKP